MGALKPYLEKLAEGQSLCREEARSALEAIVEGRAAASEIGAFLLAFRIKGETVKEIQGFLDVMEGRMVKVQLKDPEAIDVCGTGGDGRSTFNVSTTVALVAAAAGVTVAKHGNRSVSSRSGSADVLEELGVKVDLPPEQARQCIDEIGIGFLYAPLYHPAMKAVGPHRKDLEMRTFFNILGPMLNPAGVRRQLIGAFSADVAFKIAQTLQQRGYRKVCTVHSTDGLDEVSPFAASHVFEFRSDNGGLYRYPFIFPRRIEPSLRSIQVSNRKEAAAVLLDVLKGVPGAARELTVANAAFAFYVADKVSSVEEGIQLAEETIDSGEALHKLHQFVECTRDLARTSVPPEHAQKSVREAGHVS